MRERERLEVGVSRNVLKKTLKRSKNSKNHHGLLQLFCGRKEKEGGR
jgi:hypothetical protein